MKGLIDSTLREGQQQVGILFDPQQKKEIFKGLCRIGIEEIELGVVSRYDQTLAELFQWCRGRNSGKRLAVWSRCVAEDIRAAVDLAPDVISLSIPVSDLHIHKKLERDRQWVLYTLRKCLPLARQLGFPYISVGLEDATRAEPEFLDEVFALIAGLGADRIRLADTVGIADPQLMEQLTQRALHVSSLEIGVHTHNDFGMATANALSALKAGAQWADATVLGLGERAGNARLEELAAFLTLRESATYKLRSLTELAHETALMCDRAICPDRPLLGERIFACETGLHLQGLLRDPASYEPFPPESIGAARDLRLGAKIGKKLIKDRLAAKGRMVPEPQLEELVQNIRVFFQDHKASMSLSEFEVVGSPVSAPAR